MKTRWIYAAFCCALVWSGLGCGKQEPAQRQKPLQAEAAPTPKAVEVKPQPYEYPAPVKGHYHEVNVGSFDVVDGIAYRSGAGTVVFATSKPIASPMMATSPCPMTEARSLLALRDGSFLEVTLNSAGQSKYFAAGKAFGGSSREEEVGSRRWSSKLKAEAGRVKGSVQHKTEGGFEFDLPLSAPSLPQLSQSDWIEGHRTIESAPRPNEQAVTAAYRAAHDAALKKDWKALLAAIGFDEKTSAAVRGLAGIDSDLAVFADRFLQPGVPGEFTAQPGRGYVRAEGANSKGKKFANFYHFAPCGDRLVLVSIAENPQ
ncbi:MAG TPA: hypothetical protein VJA66_06440 [Thermoanaerobaculia bacterium]